jgi:signal transduction histidine kinase
MRSIRLSLIVYFLVLLTAALGAVSWFSYRTTSQSLRERQHDSQKMIAAQCEARSQAVRTELDRRILRQAQMMAGMRLVTVHYEALYPLGAIGAAAMPQGTINGPLWLPYTSKENPLQSNVYVPLWLAPGKPREGIRDLTRDINRFYPKHTHIDSSEVLVANAKSDHPQEYFQTYRGNDGQPMQRSESMGDAWFTLDKNRREQATLFTEYFDVVELKPGVKVRRVTLNTPVSGFGGVLFPGAWRGGPLGFVPNPKGPKQPPAPRPFDTKTPTLFIQYASDLGPIEEKINQFQHERNEQLANLESTINEDLRQLRSRMTWISLITLAALWLGGYLVIRLGLAPLSKMSEAVSQVSSQNFHLPLDAQKLPPELQPIAARLVEVLEHLQKAFAREKQAAADISHELRTPLAALMTTLEVGLKKSRSLDEYREILDECRASGQHMYQLVERLMALARLDAGADRYRPAETDVTEIALQCADLIRPLAKARGLALRLHLPDPITMETDLNKLREVLVNLLHNAVEYNKPAGSIDLSIEHVNGHVRVEVRDTGIGIKPQEMGHLYERFYRADPSRHADTPHAGLGLAIVKSYVDLMGGTIRVESSDAGTAFIVELPFVASAPALETAVQGAPVLAQR